MELPLDLAVEVKTGGLVKGGCRNLNEHVHPVAHPSNIGDSVTGIKSVSAPQQDLAGAGRDNIVDQSDVVIASVCSRKVSGRLQNSNLHVYTDVTHHVLHCLCDLSDHGCGATGK